MFGWFQELPRIEKELEDMVLEWEKNKDRPFLLGGKTVGDYIMEQWHKYHDHKEQEKKDRVSLMFSYTIK